MAIRWTPQASSHLAAVFSYLRETSSATVASKQIEAILIAVEQLETFPELGRPGRVEGTRELIIQASPYVVAYSLLEGTVWVLAVLHGARRWPDQF